MKRIWCFLFHWSVRYYHWNGWECGKCGEFWSCDNVAKD